MKGDRDQGREPSGIIPVVKDALLAPIRIATSPPLLRTYLRTALLFLTSSILLAVAVVAYTTFYYTYIPVRGISVPIYLQYDHAVPPSKIISSHDGGFVTPKHPYGIASVDGLVARQKYDVIVDMALPRSRNNLLAGNWMVGIDMRAPTTKGGGIKGMFGWEDAWDVVYPSEAHRSGEKDSKAQEMAGPGEKHTVVAKSRRPAILTYRSWMTELCHRALRLPLYVVGFGHESETVHIGMMEGAMFEKGWKNVPTSVRLEIRSKVPLEVYTVGVRFVARLEGLKRLMYTHRLVSAAVFISMFWSVEMAVLVMTWALVTFIFRTSGESRLKVEEGTMTPKTEAADSDLPTPLSDTSRTFPTLSSHEPLHYTSPKEERATPALEDIPIKGEEAEADDEDDDFLLDEPIPNSAAGVLTDSGIGTSMESSVERKGLSRRKSGRKD